MAQKAIAETEKGGVDAMDTEIEHLRDYMKSHTKLLTMYPHGQETMEKLLKKFQIHNSKESERIETIKA